MYYLKKLLLTQDTALKSQKGVGITGVHRFEEQVDGKDVCRGLSSVQEDDETALASEVLDEEIEEAIDNKSLGGCRVTGDQIELASQHEDGIHSARFSYLVQIAHQVYDESCIKRKERDDRCDGVDWYPDEVRSKSPKRRRCNIERPWPVKKPWPTWESVGETRPQGSTHITSSLTTYLWSAGLR